MSAWREHPDVVEMFALMHANGLTRDAGFKLESVHIGGVLVAGVEPKPVPFTVTLSAEFLLAMATFHIPRVKVSSKDFNAKRKSKRY